MSPIIIYENYGIMDLLELWIYWNYGFIGIMEFTTMVERTNINEWFRATPHHI